VRSKFLAAFILGTLAAAAFLASCDEGDSSGSGASPAGSGQTGSGGGDGDAGACDPPAAIACTDPAEAGPAKQTGAIYAINYTYLDRNRDRQLDPNAWSTYGFDLDGQASTAATANHCQPVAGADPNIVKTDGVNGIDNAFGASIAPMIASFDKAGDPTWVDNWTNGTRAGGPTMVIAFPSLTLPDLPDAGPADAGMDDAGDAGDPTQIPPDAGPLSDAGAPMTLGMLGYTTARLCAGSNPPWDVPHIVPIDHASLNCGELGNPLFAAPSGTLTGNYWFSGVVPEATVIIPIREASIAIRLKNVRVEMYISADRRLAVYGNIGGVANTEAVVAEVSAVKGWINNLTCLIPTLFDGYAEQIRQASDIMDDGTHDPAQTCNGLTMGIGFDAALVEIGDTVSVPPPPDPCAMDGG
jgi:hypothetical protein